MGTFEACWIHLIWHEQNQPILHFAVCTSTPLQLVDGSITADSKLVHSIIGALSKRQ